MTTFSNVEELLPKLINLSSISGNEAELGDFLAEYLQSQGFTVEKLLVDGTRRNVYARIGTPKVLLQAHMDVVPPFVPASEDAEYIYGRGACDTKGSIASMILAAQQAKEKGVTDFGLLFTVDEEVEFAGAIQAQSLVKELGAFLIVGEPSQLKPVNAHYGILVMTIVCTGKTAHSSEPQLGDNAIDTLLEVMAGPVKQLKIAEKTLMSLVRISGGVADNVIPDKAEALLSFRIAPDDSTDYVAELQRLIGYAGQVQSSQSLPPVATKIPASLKFLGSGQAVKYCTELSFFKNGVVLGPGDIADAHTPGEKVKKADLQKAVELYQRILAEYSAE